MILPLSFLGGVFYSIDRLPSPWHEISRANPILYMITPSATASSAAATCRSGSSLGVTAAFAALFVGWSAWLFTTGRRLKP